MKSEVLQRAENELDLAKDEYARIQQKICDCIVQLEGLRQDLDSADRKVMWMQEWVWDVEHKEEVERQASAAPALRAEEKRSERSFWTIPYTYLLFDSKEAADKWNSENRGGFCHAPKRMESWNTLKKKQNI